MSQMTRSLTKSRAAASGGAELQVGMGAEEWTALSEEWTALALSEGSSTAHAAPPRLQWTLAQFMLASLVVAAPRQGMEKGRIRLTAGGAGKNRYSKAVGAHTARSLCDV